MIKLGEETNLLVSAKAAAMVEYFPPDPTVIAPAGIELVALDAVVL